MAVFRWTDKLMDELITFYEGSIPWSRCYGFAFFIVFSIARLLVKLKRLQHSFEFTTLA